MDEWERGDADDLVLLAQVASHGGFSAAATALGMAQATVSRRIAELERRAGVRLLQRSSRKIALTDAGRRLVEHGEAFAHEMRRARASFAAFAEPRGTVRLTAPTIFGNAVLAPIIAEFAELCPDVIIAIDLDASRADLIADNFDLALRVGDLPSSSLVATRIGTGVGALFASPAYLEKAGEPVALSELAAHRLLHNRPTTRSYETATWRMRHSDGRIESLAIVPACVANHPGMLCELASNGAGIARLPLFSTASLEQSGSLRRVLPEWEAEHLEMHLLMPSREGKTPATRMLADLLIKRLKEVFAR